MTAHHSLVGTKANRAPRATRTWRRRRPCRSCSSACPHEMDQEQPPRSASPVRNQSTTWHCVSQTNGQPPRSGRKRWRLMFPQRVRATGGRKHPGCAGTGRIAASADVAESRGLATSHCHARWLAMTYWRIPYKKGYVNWWRREAADRHPAGHNHVAASAALKFRRFLGCAASS